LAARQLGLEQPQQDLLDHDSPNSWPHSQSERNISDSFGYRSRLGNAATPGVERPQLTVAVELAVVHSIGLAAVERTGFELADYHKPVVDNTVEPVGQPIAVVGKVSAVPAATEAVGTAADLVDIAVVDTAVVDIAVAAKVETTEKVGRPSSTTN
jgi:hypothetical protein